MKQISSAILAVALSIGGVMASSTAASAALPPPEEPPIRMLHPFSVTADPLVLTAQPGGGYSGVLTVSVKYIGAFTGVDYPTISIDPPANFVLGQLTGAGTCVFANGAIRCSGTGTFLRGVPRTITLQFIGFAAPANFARLATGGYVRASVGQEPSGPRGTVQVSGVLAAADGSVANPVPYTPAAAPDMGFTASNVSFNNGVLTIATTVKDFNDAFNYGASVAWSLPGATLTFISVSPPVMCFFPNCLVPGGMLFEGSERSMQLSWSVSGAPGSYSGTLRLFIDNAFGGGLPDSNPANNVINFTVTIA